jgi:hypothetical protein
VTGLGGGDGRGHGDRQVSLDSSCLDRLINGYIAKLQTAGLADLVIEAIAEPRADEQAAATHPQVADTRIAPYFLIVRPRKP